LQEEITSWAGIYTKIKNKEGFGVLGFAPFLDGYHDVASQLSDYLRRRAEAAIAENSSKKQKINTTADFLQYRQEVQEHFLEALGGLPAGAGGLNPRVTGTIQEDGYRIEKIIFQSLPNFYVTCNLYLPETEGLKAGILFTHGHSRDAKANPDYQKVCLDLVANGFAVLAVDPIGQGERFQYWRDGKEDVKASVIEHTYAGIQCSLLGMSIARYFCWDLIRALDYLCARPEVDETRIGITGTSGGGTQTSYMMLLDQRIKAAVPCTYISSRLAYMGSGQAHDMEQNLFGAISHSPDYDDFLASFAPKPVLVGAVESDFFNVEGAVHSVEQARRIYRLFGAEDKIQLKVAPGTHAYVPQLREAAVNWFRVHLLGLEPDFRTQDPAIHDPQKLNCTKTGQVLGDLLQATTIHDLLVAELEDKSKDKFTPALLEKTLAHPKLQGPKYPRVIANELVADGIVREKIFFWSEEGILVSGLLFRTKVAKDDPVLLLQDEGTEAAESSWEQIASLLAEGRDVFLFDPRGSGAVSTRQITTHGSRPFHFYETEYRLSCDAQMLGTSLAGMQVADVLRGMEYLLERTGKERVVLAGRGKGALLAAFAAPLGQVSQLRLSPLPESFASVVNRRLYRPERVPILFGPLNSWDLPDLYQYLREQKVEIYQQINQPLGPRLGD
jgi:cephalosporin-C deacetylase-like acetyl esterase